MSEEMDESGARDRSGIQSVEVAGAILGALVEAQKPVGLAEIARISGLNPAKVHRYLVSLARIRLVEQDAGNGRYGPGPLAVPLAFARLRTMNVVTRADPILADLRDATGETALLAIWSERGPVVIRLEESARPVFLNVRVGSTLPLYESATGKMFAAHMRAEQLREIATPPKGWSEVTAAKIRKDGLATISGALVSGVNAMAAPVFDAFGALAGVIGLLGREQDLDMSAGGSNAAALADAGARLSAQLGKA